MNKNKKLIISLCLTAVLTVGISLGVCANTISGVNVIKTIGSTHRSTYDNVVSTVTMKSVSIDLSLTVNGATKHYYYSKKDSVDFGTGWISTYGTTYAKSFVSAQYYGAPYSWTNTTYDYE